MKKRRWLFQLQSFFWLVLPWNALFQKAQLWSFETHQLGKFDGIVLTTTLPDRAGNELFVQTTDEALAWLKEEAPRHYRRVLRHTRFICDQPLPSCAQWSEGNKACIVDFSRWAPLISPDHEDRDWYLADYAATLVHEATHGRLEALYFPYTKATRSRIERICMHAEQGVLKCLWEWENDEARDGFFQDYQQEQQSGYSTYWQLSVRQKWAQIRETIRRVRTRER